MPDLKKFECDKCGACCRFPIIEIDYFDIIREPRMREVTKPFKVPDGQQFVDNETDEPIENPDPYMAGAMLACGTIHPCPFVGADNLCGIYPTRPNCCVGFEAGTRLCQESREAHGLPPLLPVEVAKPPAAAGA